MSTIVKGTPQTSTRSVRRSRVVPGTSVTIARDAPASRLNRLDLPALGRPTIAIVRPSRISFPRAASVSSTSSDATVAVNARAVSAGVMK